MNKKPLAWSYSRLNAFEYCGVQFYHQTIKKDVPFIQNDAMKEGDFVHKILDKRITSATPLPDGYTKYEGICQQVTSAPGQTFSEMKLALDWKLRPCGYRDWDNVQVRMILDVVKVHGQKVWVGDWKTGVPNNDETQLKLFAAGVFSVFPEVKEVTTSYIWLKEGKLDPSDSKHYTRDQHGELWVPILAKAQRLQDAYFADNWKPRPGKHCRWCTVNKFGKCPAAAMPYKEWK